MSAPCRAAITHVMLWYQVSMSSAGFIYDVNRFLQLAKASNLPFGGVNVYFMGDFSQLPPVGHQPVYASQRGRVADEQGHMLWKKEIHATIVLTKNYRARNDPVWAGLLSRWRSGDGSLSETDIASVNARVCASRHPPPTSGSQREVLCFKNKDRYAWHACTVQCIGCDSP